MRSQASPFPLAILNDNQPYSFYAPFLSVVIFFPLEQKKVTPFLHDGALQALFSFFSLLNLYHDHLSSDFSFFLSCYSLFMLPDFIALAFVTTHSSLLLLLLTRRSEPFILVFVFYLIFCSFFFPYLFDYLFLFDWC